jgi:hypothetical protein
LPSPFASEPRKTVKNLPLWAIKIELKLEVAQDGDALRNLTDEGQSCSGGAVLAREARS